MLIDVTESQLVLVDLQARLMPVVYEGDAVVANALRLAKVASLLSVPTWGTEQNPDGLGANVSEIKALCRKTLSKVHFSAVQDGLVDLLRPAARAQSGNARSLPKHLQKPAPVAEERSTVLIAGCETHVCVLQTALELLEQEFDVCVVTDACSSRTERNRDAAFDRLAGAGVELLTTEMVIFEWLRHCEHDQFKQVLTIVK